MTPRALCLLLPIALVIQACAGNETPAPATTDLLKSIPRVENSSRAPCWQQKQIAAQNTALDTALKKTTDVYKAPCEVPPRQQPPPARAVARTA